MRKNKEFEIDVVMSMRDFYILHAALRTLAANIDFMRENVFDRGADAYNVELEIEQLADKISIYIEQLKKERDVFN